MAGSGRRARLHGLLRAHALTLLDFHPEGAGERDDNGVTWSLKNGVSTKAYVRDMRETVEKVLVPSAIAVSIKRSGRRDQDELLALYRRQLLDPVAASHPWLRHRQHSSLTRRPATRGAPTIGG